MMSGAASPDGPQSQLLAGVPSGTATAKVLSLSLKDVVDRGLRYNLGIILGQQSIRAAQSSRLRTLSDLLPHVTVQTSETVEQVNLASVGFSGFPGIPQMVGPFGVFDIRAYVSQSLLDLSKVSELQARTENVRATQHAYKNTRDLVALACLQLYMQAVAGGSRVEANQAQLKTAQVLYELALSRRSAGLVPGIEVLRAQVQMQAQQQRLIVAQNDFAKQKLNLAQAIGLPLGQEFQLTDQIPYTPFAPIAIEDALQDAYRYRGDYQSAMAQVKEAERSREAAVRQRAPSMDLNANYGDIGQRPFNSHGSFLVAMSLRIPIFQGRETESKILASDAQLEQQKADLESLRARIYYEIRTVLLDLKSSEDRVLVAQSSLDLATEQVTQAQDRFAAGVVSNIEVVQAQDALATATEDYISSLYAHNIAKATLAEAMGMAESGYEKLLRGK
ncbi:MAG: TolC family protein [Acidobacteriia bacterium]|nr:TolC family protein [Terriglobia bacterium]